MTSQIHSEIDEPLRHLNINFDPIVHYASWHFLQSRDGKTEAANYSLAATAHSLKITITLLLGLA